MPTVQEFIERWPLYTRADIVDFAPPESITRMCGGADCKRETTWFFNQTVEVAMPTGSVIEFSAVGYTCGLCKKNSLVVVYRLLNWTETKGSQFWSHKAVQKIGQIPAPTIEIPPQLAERLLQTATYYKNALVCRS
jgi:hypothetical protein